MPEGRHARGAANAGPDITVRRRCPLCSAAGEPAPVCTEAVAESHLRNWPEEWRAVFTAVRVVRCRACGFVYVWEDIPETLLQAHYQRDFDLERVFAEDAETKIAIYLKILALLEKHRPAKGALLDIGSFEGALLSVARQRGWHPTGVEVDARAAEFSRAKLQVPVVMGTLADARFPDDHFDAVTLVDVLEHLKHPLETLGEIARVLKAGGVVGVSVPNFPFQYVKEKWVKRALGRPGSIAEVVHLNHFTAKTLSFAFERAGLQPLWSGVPPIHYEGPRPGGARPRWGNLIRRAYYELSVVATAAGVRCGASILALAGKPDDRRRGV
jgi:SAM-dependent methyltransferase